MDQGEKGAEVVLRRGFAATLVLGIARVAVDGNRGLGLATRHVARPGAEQDATVLYLAGPLTNTL